MTTPSSTVETLGSFAALPGGVPMPRIEKDEVPGPGPLPCFQRAVPFGRRSETPGHAKELVTRLPEITEGPTPW